MAKTKTQPELRFAGFTEDWQKDFVGTYYDFKNGLNKSKEYFGYGKPIVNFTDVFHKRGLLSNHLNGKVDVTSDEINNYSVKKGDLFFTRTSETIEEIGQPSVMLDEPKQAVFSGFVLRARAINEDPLEIGFKQYAFFTNSFRSEMVKKSSMTTRALTSGTAIKKMLFTFPKSKTEQKLIGNFFENLDKLITEHQQKHTKLKSLKQAMLDKMFPKQGQTVPEIRFKGFEGDWVEYELNDLCTLITKQTGFDYSAIIKPSLTRRYTNSTYSFIQNKDFESTNINLTTDFYIPKNIAENYPNILIDRPSILISISGKIGNVGLYQLSEKAFVGGAVGICKLTNESDGLIILYKLLSNSGQNYFQSLIKASSHSNITVYDIRKIKVQIPNSNDERIKIGNYFKNLDELIDKHETQITKLQNIKKALLAKMFI